MSRRKHSAHVSDINLHSPQRLTESLVSFPQEVGPVFVIFLEVRLTTPTQAFRIVNTYRCEIVQDMLYIICSAGPDSDYGL